MKRNHAISFILTLGLAVLLGGSAAAQPLCHGALRLRVNDKGLAFIGEQVRPLVPKSVAIPAIKKSVLDWPVAKSDAIVETTLQPAQIKLHDLTLSISGDALQVRGKADVSTSGPVTVHNAYMGVGTANCRADVNIKDLELVVGIKFTTNGGRITTKVTEALITLDNDKSKLALEKCTLGNILTTVVTFLRKHFMGAIQAGVAKIAKSKIPALVSAKLDESIRITKQVKGFQVTGTLDALSTDSLGVEVGLGAGVGLVSESHPPCLGKVNTKAPVSCTSVQPTLKPAVDAMFGVGVSQQIINHGLHAAWRSGMLCVDSERITSPLLTDNLSKLAPALGLPASTRLDFSLRLLTAPRVSMTSDGGMALQIDPMLLRLVMDPPKGPRNEMIISAGMTVAVAPWINPEDNSVSLDVKSMNISRLEMQPPAGSAGKAITLDVARLNRFITTVAVPMIKERLSGSPISPSVIAVKSFLVELKRVDVGNGFIAAYVNGHRPVLGKDRNRPETTLSGTLPPLVGPGVLSIKARGTDDQTPAALMRFSARVDRGKWTTPAYGGRLQIAVSGGQHRVEVVAVDQDGNRDLTPAVYSVLVDDKAPQLQTWDMPDPVVTADAITIGFDGRDDRTAKGKLLYVAQLFRNNPADGGTDLVEHQTLGAGVNSATFKLREDGTYRVRVTVKDEAGNVTSTDAGFLYDPTGCSISRAAGGELPPAGLVLALLLLAARRRRAR